MKWLKCLFLHLTFWLFQSEERIHVWNGIDGNFRCNSSMWVFHFPCIKLSLVLWGIPLDICSVEQFLIHKMRCIYLRRFLVTGIHVEMEFSFILLFLLFQCLHFFLWSQVTKLCLCFPYWFIYSIFLKWHFYFIFLLPLLTLAIWLLGIPDHVPSSMSSVNVFGLGYVSTHNFVWDHVEIAFLFAFLFALLFRTC